jgi:hypothetical protein
MRNLLKWMGTAVAGVIGLVLGGLVSGLEGLDHQPYFKAPYYARTLERLHAATNRTLIVHGPLAAGFGKARLTPTLNAVTNDPVQGQFTSMPLAGYGNRRGRPATGVHDDVWVKAIAVRVADHTAVWVGADALIIPREVSEEALGYLTEAPGLSREQVYFGATHTHGSLGGWGEGVVAEAFAGPYQPGVRTWVAQQLVVAVRAAVADLQPAAVGQGHLDAPEFIRNRLVGKLGRIDPELSFAFFRQAGGRTAVLGSYSAHATVLSGGNMEFSGDYPGYWQREVESATGGMAMFLAGGVGSHSPQAGGGGFEGAERMGRALAQRVVERLPQVPLTNTVVLGVLGCAIDLPELHMRLTDDWRLRPVFARRLLPVKAETFVQTLRLGQTVWVSTPCDFSGELALDLKDFLRARGGNAVVTSFNGDYIGYVIPARYYHLEGYEPRVMSFFGPNVPDYFTDMIRTMAGDLGLGD